MLRKILALGLIVALSLSVWPVQARPLASVLDIGAGVRAVSMGEAFTGLADDEYALFYNPAGLATLTGGRASLLYQTHFGASTYLSAYGSFGNLGAGLTFFSFGQVPCLTSANQPCKDAQGKTISSFGYSNLALVAGWGAPMKSLPFLSALPEGLALGLRLKFISISSLDPTTFQSLTITGIVLDPSFLWALGKLGPVERVRVGLVLENLLGLALGASEGEGFPIGLRLGLSASPLGLVTLNTDFSLADGFHLGAEYTLRDLGPLSALSLRTGLLTRTGLGISVGLGVLFAGIQIDYALFLHPDLGGSHWLSASYRF
ncbi:MAG: hypothetical protein NZ610_00060 [Candidatus Bipolaricaulota bacterium]|nr:hypothetical protein [Candidatus Bipolaricaulota bacterium]MDW8111135.1 hypothetical protein [Candidatus Bipolaricaulota bacterium]MDW8329751.1 hypothetical protein [Candidatus Bipolaricaulota bacterium]